MSRVANSQFYAKERVDSFHTRQRQVHLFLPEKMQIKNFEFKVKVDSIEPYESKLRTLNAEFYGTDHQIDTYFSTGSQRLKLREGNIENALISYDRKNTADAKLSDVVLYKHEPDAALKNILSIHFGVQKVVVKTRKIYFIGNVKFHFDEVKGLGFFVEVEAIDSENAFSVEELKTQCDKYYTF